MFIYDYVPHADAVEQPAEAVQSTVTVAAETPPSVAPGAPDVNEHQFDAVTEGGLTTHQVASAIIPSTQYPPLPKANVGDAVQSIINDRIATTGTAAAREAAGHWGHGTMPIIEGIEPAISAAPFDNRYFAAPQHEVQSTDYLTPVTTDAQEQALAQALATTNTRDATSPYSALVGW